jgi:hypothetical protein
MVLAIYQIILHLKKITECLKMTTFKIVFTLDVFFSAETTMHCKVTCILYKKQAHFQSALLFTSTIIVRDSSVVRRHYIFLLEPWDVRELYIRKTADLLLQLWVSTFPRFVAIGFYFLSETLI